MTCPHCAAMQEELAWLRSELGLQRSTDQLVAIGETFGLTLAEAQLVHALFRANGRVVHRAVLLEAMPSPYGLQERDLKQVNAIVCRIRKAMGDNAIENIRGLGYRLAALTAERIAALTTITQEPAHAG
jgi:DNA-binding response OmpR family regulator